MISMFQTWRWKLRAAQQACEQGRLDEALDKLQADDLRQFQPAQPLIELLAAKLQRRALLRLASADPAAAWRDLRLACGLVGETAEVMDTRRLLVAGELDAAKQFLAGGQSTPARLVLERLVDQRAATTEVRGWLEVVQHCESSRQLLARGKFAEAEAAWIAASALQPEASFLTTRQATVTAEAEAGRKLTDQLQEAARAGDWGDVRTFADDVLKLAPACDWARELRRRAWAHMAPLTELDRRRPRLDATQSWRPSTIRLPDRGTSDHDHAERLGATPRLLLWVDGVGGYLVCLGESVSLGQAASPGSVDVPILGDLSRQHAMVRRDGENYLVVPRQPVRVRGQLVGQPTLLRDGDELSLGEQVRVRFRQPHVLSASARLEWVSRHRSQPSADGVILMAESLVLGPDAQNHIVCRHWSHDVVLYRRDGQLFCRSSESLEVDGRWSQGEAALESTSRIAGRNFAISLETV